MMSKRLKAFTLVELLISMILTGIIIASVSAFYLISNNRFKRGIKDANYVKDHVLLNDIIEHDVTKAFVLKYLSERKMVCLKKDEMDSVSYSFLDTVVVRQSQASSDTFYVKVENMNFLFKGEPQTQQNGLIDYIAFELLLHNYNSACVYRKEYSAETHLY